MTESHTETHQSERKRRLTATWLLAILTIPAAIVVFLYGMAAVMSLAGCTDLTCAHKGPNEFWFGILFYGALVVPVVTIAVSFFTAKFRRGIVVPVVALALLAIDFAVLALTFRP
jgi:hypothetical protein